jgi:hypothetical protein
MAVGERVRERGRIADATSTTIAINVQAFKQTWRQEGGRK